MEKRWCQRIPVTLEVMVHYHGRRLAKCAVENISLCGINLRSGPLSFQRDTPLQIQMLDADHLGEGQDMINAIVVRNSPDGVGLMFSPTEPEMLRSIIRQFKKHGQHPAVTGTR